MIKAAVFDDEYIVIKGLLKMIDWRSYGIEIIGTAHDGLEAMDIIRRHEPEFILTDIRMPGMDGLQIIEKVKRLYPDTYAIVFSGYNEFEYVKRAIQIGASDYLEKPITVQNVRRAVEKAVEQIRRNHEIRSSMVKKRRTLLQMTTIELLQGKLQDITAWKEALGELTEQLTAVTVLASSEPLELEDQDGDIFIHAHLADCSIIVILHRNKPNQPLWEYIEQCADIPIGVGTTYDVAENMLISYKEAKKALRCAQYLQHSGLLAYEDLGDLLTVPKDVSEREEGIILSLRAGNYAGLMEEIDRFIEWLRSEPFDPEIVERELVKLLYLALSATNEIDRLSERGQAMPHVELMNLKEKDEMLRWFREQIDQIVKPTLEIRENSKHATIEQAKRYIERHLADDLSLHKLADHLNMNASYLSMLFKEVTGMTYIKYLTRYRMEIAKKLLIEGRKVSEVSELVGYYTHRHFTEVFKKHTGMTPGQYRAQYEEIAMHHPKKTDNMQ